MRLGTITKNAVRRWTRGRVVGRPPPRLLAWLVAYPGSCPDVVDEAAGTCAHPIAYQLPTSRTPTMSSKKRSAAGLARGRGCQVRSWSGSAQGK